MARLICGQLKFGGKSPSPKEERKTRWESSIKCCAIGNFLRTQDNCATCQDQQKWRFVRERQSDTKLWIGLSSETSLLHFFHLSSTSAIASEFAHQFSPVGSFAVKCWKLIHLSICVCFKRTIRKKLPSTALFERHSKRWKDFFEVWIWEDFSFLEAGLTEGR